MTAQTRCQEHRTAASRVPLQAFPHSFRYLTLIVFHSPFVIYSIGCLSIIWSITTCLPNDVILLGKWFPLMSGLYLHSHWHLGLHFWIKIHLSDALLIPLPVSPRCDDLWWTVWTSGVRDGEHSQVSDPAGSSPGNTSTIWSLADGSRLLDCLMCLISGSG